MSIERFIACPECATFRRADGSDCPGCGSTRVVGKVSVAAAALMAGLAVTGCIGPGGGGDGDAVALYGVPDTSVFEDNDGDGYNSDEDCDDDDPDIHPDAEEIAGDGVDSNCNDDDDT